MHEARNGALALAVEESLEPEFFLERVEARVQFADAGQMHRVDDHLIRAVLAAQLHVADRNDRRTVLQFGDARELALPDDAVENARRCL